MSEAWTTHYLRDDEGQYAGSYPTKEQAQSFLDRNPKWAGFHVESVSMRCAACGPSTKTPYYPATGSGEMLCSQCWTWADKIGWCAR